MKADENTIILHKDEDGNWSGKWVKFGKEITSREVGPETALQVLLTHD